MIPIVDARSGKVVKVGEPVEYPPCCGAGGVPEREGFRLESISLGVFSGKAVVTTWRGSQSHTAVVPVPIKWFPKMIYGDRFPVGTLRAAILPS